VKNDDEFQRFLLTGKTRVNWRFSCIVMRKADISEFDTFVENWKNQGGDQILKEINDELSK